MSWESVDALPATHTSGSPYHGAAEPVVARRGGPTALERVRQYFRSTPELPSSQAAREVVLTPNHVYVERMTGARQRVPLDALRGRRVDGPRVIYGIHAGEDLALLARPGCPVMAELDARVMRPGEPAETALTFRTARALGLGLATPALLLGLYFLTEYSLDEMWDRIHDGLYTAEVVLGVAAGFACVLVGLALLFTVPVTWRVDAVGVHRAHGILPWLHYHEPPEDFRAVHVQTLRSPERAPFAIEVRLLRRDEKRRELIVTRFSARSIGAAAEAEAMELARRLGRHLGVPVQRAG
ncbi:MAG: hypothetical protein R3B40_21075 [Polyangiales bacterium]